MAKFFISEKDAPIEEVTAEKTLPLLASFVTSNFNTLKITKHLHKTVDMPSKPGGLPAHGRLRAAAAARLQPVPFYGKMPQRPPVEGSGTDAYGRGKIIAGPAEG